MIGQFANGHKRFDSNLHAENDRKARSAGRKLFPRFGVEVRDNPDILGVDLFLLREGKIRAYAEGEVKHKGWMGTEFPWDNLHIPHRKEKILQLNLSQVFFFVVNHLGNRVAVVRDENLRKCSVVEKFTEYTKELEPFFEIPMEYVKIHSI